MEPLQITPKERELADKCVACPVCQHARQKQKGFAYWFVKRIEGNICPACSAYEKVYGKKAYEPVTPDN